MYIWPEAYMLYTWGELSCITSLYLYTESREGGFYQHIYNYIPCTFWWLWTSMTDLHIDVYVHVLPVDMDISIRVSTC